MIITNEQKQVMLSGLLGDGSIKHSHIFYNCMYREYMVYKRKLAGNLAKSEVIENDNLGYKKGSKIYSFSMKLNDYARDLELVGHPIKLNDVLEYVGYKFYQENRAFMMGTFSEPSGNGNLSLIEHILWSWDLSSVFLADQSEELKEFLNSL